MTEPTPTIPEKISFFFIKSNYYRVVHVDGAFGGLTPQGKVFVSMYSERAPIPEIITHELKDSGSRLGQEIIPDRKSKEGIIREVEVGLSMDEAAAEAFHKWLGEQIQILKSLKIPTLR
jgi:hypothetical protein